MTSPLQTIEPELTGQTPRAVHFTRGAQIIRVTLLAFLIGSVWLIAWLASRDLNDLIALRAVGRTTTASVMGKHATYNKTTTYYLDYGFMGNWVWVGGEEEVSDSEYDRAEVGDQIPVTYLPDHPQTHRIGRVDGGRISRQRARWTRGGLLAFLFLGAFVLALEANYRSQRRLLREGVRVAGEVTDRSTVRGKSMTYSVTYRYPLSLGEWQTKKLPVDSRIYAQSLPGSALTVLYDRNRPSNSRPYRTITCARLC